MGFGLINWINAAAVACLILINVIAAGKGGSHGFRSKHLIINVFEQIGRYGCMAFMILPIFTKGWEFGFASVAEMVIWLLSTILLLMLYSVLWIKKARGGGVATLYGLAVLPVILFLSNGILLRHLVLIVAALFFGVFHLIIVKENT